MIAISTAPLVGMQLADHLNDQGDGTYTVSLADGTVLSCQADGTFQTRPAGTNGAFERCTVSGGYLTFKPRNVPFTFAYVGAVPNVG